MNKGKCKECNKICLDKKTAQTKRNYLSSNRAVSNNVLRIYHCPFCDYWHLTKQPKRNDKKY